LAPSDGTIALRNYPPQCYAITHQPRANWSAPAEWSRWNVSLGLAVAPAWPAEPIGVAQPATRRMRARTPRVLVACIRLRREARLRSGPRRLSGRLNDPQRGGSVTPDELDNSYAHDAFGAHFAEVGVHRDTGEVWLASCGVKFITRQFWTFATQSARSRPEQVQQHSVQKLGLLDHLVGDAEQRRRHGEAEHPGRLCVDD